MELLCAPSLRGWVGEEVVGGKLWELGGGRQQGRLGGKGASARESRHHGVVRE